MDEFVLELFTLLRFGSQESGQAGEAARSDVSGDFRAMLVNGFSDNFPNRLAGLLFQQFHVTFSSIRDAAGMWLSMTSLRDGDPAATPGARSSLLLCSGSQRQLDNKGCPLVMAATLRAEGSIVCIQGGPPRWIVRASKIFIEQGLFHSRVDGVARR
jgi:hypothetical protein